MEQHPTTGSGKGSARRNYNIKKYNENFENIKFPKRDTKKKKK